MLLESSVTSASFRTEGKQRPVLSANPAGAFRVTVPPRRTLHVRFNELRDPEPIHADTDYASVVESDVPIVVRHSHLDSRQEANARLSTIAFGSDT